MKPFFTLLVAILICTLSHAQLTPAGRIPGAVQLMPSYGFAYQTLIPERTDDGIFMVVYSLGNLGVVQSTELPFLGGGSPEEGFALPPTALDMDDELEFIVRYNLRGNIQYNIVDDNGDSLYSFGSERYSLQYVDPQGQLTLVTTTETDSTKFYTLPGTIITSSSTYSPVFTNAEAFPNPAENVIHLPHHLPGSAVGLLRIFDAAGTLRKEILVSGSQGNIFSLDLDGLTPGTYHWSLGADSGSFNVTSF